MIPPKHVSRPKSFAFSSGLVGGDRAGESGMGNLVFSLKHCPSFPTRRFKKMCIRVAGGMEPGCSH